MSLLQTNSKPYLRLYLKVAINGEFKPLFLKRKYPNKLENLEYLKECILKTMMKLFYPYNVDINVKDNLLNFNSLTLSESRGIVIYVECKLRLPPVYEINKQNIEKQIRLYNIHPDFIKYIKIVNHQVILI